MKTLSQKTFNQLLNLGYTEIEFDVDRYLKSIIPEFLRLTEEPKPYREEWLVDLSGDLKDPDDGFMERRKEDGKDEKFLFHYRPQLKGILKSRGVKIARYEYLFEQCEILYSFCAYAAERVIRDLDQAFPEHQLLKRFFDRDALTRHVARFNRYKVGDEVKAKNHEDQSFLTIAPAGSAPALYLWDNTECFQPEKGKTLIFLGEKAEYLDEKLFKAVPHHVKMKPNEWRWSMVFFTHIDVGISDQEVEAFFKEKRKLQTTT